MSFHERFKSKFSKVSKHGELNVSSESAVKKPYKTQLHSPVYRSVANTVLNSYHKVYNSQNTSNSNPVNFKPMISKSPPMDLKRKYFPKLPIVNNYTTFKPYSLKDYNLIKPKKYYVLGGVGPVHIGSNDWINKMQFLTKRKRYGKDVNEINLRRVCKSTEFYSEKNTDLLIQKKLGSLQANLLDDNI